MLEKIEIEIIPHDKQRYDTVGDWYYKDDGKTLVMKVSRMSKWEYELLVLIHELAELTLCKKDGITAEMVDEYDFKKLKDIDNAAWEPEENIADAPYYKQHSMALDIERVMCHFLGENWTDYGAEIDKL